MHSKLFFFLTLVLIPSTHASFLPTSQTAVIKKEQNQTLTFETVATSDKPEVLSCTQRQNGSVACWVKYITVVGRKVEHEIASDNMCKDYFALLAKQYTEQPKPEIKPQLATYKPKLNLKYHAKFAARLEPAASTK